MVSPVEARSPTDPACANGAVGSTVIAALGFTAARSVATSVAVGSLEGSLKALAPRLSNGAVLGTRSPRTGVIAAAVHVGTLALAATEIGGRGLHLLISVTDVVGAACGATLAEVRRITVRSRATSHAFRAAIATVRPVAPSGPIAQDVRPQEAKVSLLRASTEVPTMVAYAPVSGIVSFTKEVTGSTVLAGRYAGVAA